MLLRFVQHNTALKKEPILPGTNLTIAEIDTAA